MIKVKYRHGRKNTLASLNEDKGYVFRMFLVVIFLTACALAVLKIISTVLPHMWGIISYFPLVILGALIYMGGMCVQLFALAVNWWILIFSLIFPKDQIMINCELSDDRLVGTLFKQKERTTYKFAYESVKKAVERNGYFIIFTKEINFSFAFSDITDGDASALRSLLNEKLGDRFTVK